jgi:peptidoglycan hydrolase CwlO-like protein
MKFQRIISCIALPSLIVGAVLMASSCRSLITPEQLQELKDLRAKEKSLTEQIQDKKNEVSKIKSEISARQSELKKCNDESDFIKQKLAQWPNVWPDWQPEPPQPETPVVPEKKKKK